MALRNDIETIRDRALATLNEAHDYFTYTKGAWRTLQLAVQRDGLKFSLRNPSTNSTVNEQALLGHAQRYVAEDLASATLQQFVSIFENFLSDALRLWLLAYPMSFAKRQLSGKEICQTKVEMSGISAKLKCPVQPVARLRQGWLDAAGRRSLPCQIRSRLWTRWWKRN